MNLMLFDDDQANKKKKEGRQKERHKTRWSSSSMLEYMRERVRNKRCMPASYVVFGENEKMRETKRARERGEKKRRVFSPLFLSLSRFARYSFAYFSIHPVI